MNRMNQSANALCMPMFNGREFLRCIKELVKLDKHWIPTQKGYSLYVRPTIISTEETIGISVPKKVKLFVILSPVGPYYPSGFAAVKLYANTKNVRAWPGGVGNVKAGGNYAPTIKCQLEASKKGCAQVLWLFGKDFKITEGGTMNQFLERKNKQGAREVITAPLDGVILAGVTRDSIRSMLREENEYKVVERKYTLAEIIEAISEDRLLEAFGSGTAAIVSPVKGIIFNGKEYQIPLDHNNPKEQSGKLTRHLFHRLLRIQYGEEDHQWSKIIE
jgi:branched-chain amino acid aminotransferase